MDARTVIIEPVVSEKSYALMSVNKYTFRVHENANKTQIGQAVEEIFDVKVAKVRTSTIKSKPKSRGGFRGRTREWKKAIVELQPGSRIDLFEGAATEYVMAIKRHKPTSPGRRFATWLVNDEVTKTTPEKSLTRGLRKTGGRNSNGRKTARHKGGGAKRAYRTIDFKRNKDGVPAKVAAIEYDPNRTANIALLHYHDGEKRHILAPEGLKVGKTVQSGFGAEINVGNSLPLSAIPTGTVIHAVELQPGKGAQLGRSAGAAIQLAAKEGAMATLRLPSGEMRMVPATCRATIGEVGNSDHQNVTIGKAGRARHMGKRPQTRGVAMNPVDHPHGGGEAHKTPGGHPTTPWGKPALGYRTRKKNKKSDDLIVRGRKRGKGRRR